jgi:hypothetical protein
MAQVRLGKDEVQSEQLPPTCMHCGAPATVYKSRTFSWSPPWAYPPIVALMLTKYVRVSAPLCDRHKYHWLGRLLLVVLSLLGIVGLGVVGGAVGLMLEMDAGPESGGSAVFGGVMVVCAVLLVAWVVMLIVLSLTSIRAKEITADTITLTGVHDAFVKAVYEREDRDEEERPRRRASEREAGPKRKAPGRPTRRGGD